MKQFFRISKIIIALAVFSLLANVCLAQTSYRSSNVFSAKILGTSNLHDWEMKSTEGKCSCLVTLDANDKIIAVSALSFVIRVESFVTDHSMMNNKTYEALKSKENPNIVFTLTSTTVTQINPTTARVKAIGKLNIAGAIRDAEIIAFCSVNPDLSINCVVSKKLKMTDFNIKPPSVLMGSIKTGDDITVEFAFKLSK